MRKRFDEMHYISSNLKAVKKTFRIKFGCAVTVVFDKASERRSSFTPELGVCDSSRILCIVRPQPGLPQFLHLSVVIYSSTPVQLLGLVMV
jgi:hypothetical protein